MGHIILFHFSPGFHSLSWRLWTSNFWSAFYKGSQSHNVVCLLPPVCIWQDKCNVGGHRNIRVKRGCLTAISENLMALVHDKITALWFFSYRLSRCNMFLLVLGERLSNGEIICLNGRNILWNYVLLHANWSTLSPCRLFWPAVA